MAQSIGVPVGRIADIGNGADVWIGLQAQYDVAKTRKALGKRLDREVGPIERAA